MSLSLHTSVLLHESIEILEPSPGDVFVDGTIAGGGHSLEMCRQYGSSVRLIGIDVDQAALERAQKAFEGFGCEIHLHHGNFKEIGSILTSEGLDHADRILFDLGWSSDQFELSGKGFSFQRDEPLLMTLGNPSEYSLTAQDLVNNLGERGLEAIIRSYGEESRARRIAKAIVAKRKDGQITTSRELALLIEQECGNQKGRLHPATKTFQALRMAVNSELESLETGLIEAFDSLSAGGRLAVITFHSLEDRIVKRFFQARKANGEVSLLTKKPIRPTDEEIKNNPRSRSAKLRAVEKINDIQT